jgi:cholest-4-en-3-one 26-monooxygenase
LLEHREIMPTAIEEILPWASPVTQLALVATKDTELGGKRIRTGDRLALWFASADRDDAVFENPFTFDLRRSPNEHLAFSKGEHFCAGTHLARLELRLTLQALLPRITKIELAGTVERLRSDSIADIKHLPVRFRES